MLDRLSNQAQWNAGSDLVVCRC